MIGGQGHRLRRRERRNPYPPVKRCLTLIFQKVSDPNFFLDAYTVDAKVKKAGVIVNATRLLVSMDGRLLTITENGTDQNGRATHGTRIYNRQ